MNDTIITVENLSKRYRLGVIGATTLRDSFQRTWHRLRGRNWRHHMEEVGVADQSLSPTKNQERRTKNDEPRTTNQEPVLSDEIWALKDVSFEVKRGEVLGIIGRNGAGKSTLLKLLTRITEPTSGRAIMRGRVASLLEVGTGFHPELTGRENVYLNGAILGMRRAEITDKFDEIVDFSGVDRFIDTPVKRYSSGMYVRLAFAVAAHLDPEILLVDEVLAVGDTDFQKKCLGKMGEISKSGKTVLFVSHNMFSIRNLCSRAVLLKQGAIEEIGNVNNVVDAYLTAGAEKHLGEVRWDDPIEAPGDARLRLVAMRVVSEGQMTGEVDLDKEFQIEVEYRNLEPNARRLVSFHVHNAEGICVFTSANLHSACSVHDKWFSRLYPIGLFRTQCDVPAYLLNDGSYTVSVYINQKTAVDNVVVVKNVLQFIVRDSGTMRKEYTHGKWLGVVRPRLAWRTEQLDENGSQIPFRDISAGSTQ